VDGPRVCFCVRARVFGVRAACVVHPVENTLREHGVGSKADRATKRRAGGRSSCVLLRTRVFCVWTCAH
jgi:hypothetical protein